MAKEQWHSWAKTLLIVATIIFAGGGYAMKIKGHDDAIKEGKEVEKEIIKKVECNSSEIVDLKLKYKDLEALSSSIDKSLQSINTSISTITTIQQQTRTDMAVVKVKVDTLTKDE